MPQPSNDTNQDNETSTDRSLPNTAQFNVCNGIPIFTSSVGDPQITSAQVKELLENEW